MNGGAGDRTSGPTFEDLFDPAFLARIAALSLRVGMAQKGGRLAEQRTSARGQGSDFADFKPYVPGDDLRTVDWNVYRRLGRVFVRVFEERQDLPLHILVDLSGSMFVEEPPRIHAALRATLAIAAIALNQHDSVRLLPFSDTVAADTRPVSGRGGLIPIARRLADFTRMGGTALAAGIDRVAAMRLRRGLVVVVSDFFDDAGIDAVTASLSRLPHRLLLVQMVKAHDADPSLHPDLRGDVVIEDGESDRIALTITPALLDRYRQAYRAFDGALTDFAAARGAGLVRIDAAGDVPDQLVALFGSGALVL